MPSSQAVVELAQRAAISRTGATTLLDIDKIRELVDMMVANDLVEISLRDGETEVTLRRPGPPGAAAPVVAALPPAVLPSPPGGAPLSAGASAAVEDEASEDETELTAIKSPMVGTFYASSEPGAPPLVDVGSPITADTVVCIVEAMKVFNEIKAEISGTIEQTLVKNEDPIEYGQPLFLVRPHG